jgi:hypothetical protein
MSNILAPCDDLCCSNLNHSLSIISSRWNLGQLGSLRRTMGHWCCWAWMGLGNGKGRVYAWVMIEGKDGETQPHSPMGPSPSPFHPFRPRGTLDGARHKVMKPDHSSLSTPNSHSDPLNTRLAIHRSLYTYHGVFRLPPVLCTFNCELSLSAHVTASINPFAEMSDLVMRSGRNGNRLGCGCGRCCCWIVDCMLLPPSVVAAVKG